MTALFCSRHQIGWNSPPVLCPVCQDDEANGGKVAHQDRTPQEEADYQRNADDTPRINYASSCGTGALVVEAKKIERELAAALKPRVPANIQTIVAELRRWHGLKGAIVFKEAADELERLGGARVERSPGVEIHDIQSEANACQHREYCRGMEKTLNAFAARATESSERSP